MTEAALKNYIRCFNSNKWKYPASFFDINPNVTVGLILSGYDKKKTIDFRSERFFFIKNKEQCVGIIFDMNTDLHWLILKKYRKQGYLYNALKKIIFPYLKSQGRQEQRCTAKTFETQQYLLRFGFEPQGGCEYSLSLKKFKKINPNKIRYRLLTDNQFEIMRIHAYEIINKLRIMSDQLECSLGNTYSFKNYSNIIWNKIMDIGLDYKIK